MPRRKLVLLIRLPIKTLNRVCCHTPTLSLVKFHIDGTVLTLKFHTPLLLAILVQHFEKVHFGSIVYQNGQLELGINPLQVKVIYSRAILVTVTSECTVKRVICKTWTGTLAYSSDQDQTP